MELRVYLRILAAHWLGIILLTLLGVAVAFGWTLVQSPVYTADAGGYVARVRTAESADDSGSALVADNLAKSKVKSYLDLGTWRSVAERAADDLGLDDSPESLVRRIEVSNARDTVNITVAASAPTAEGARDLAQAWVRAMAAEIEALESNNGQSTALVQLVAGDSAQLPSAPSSPNVRLALLIGALAGLLVGIGYAFLRYTLDRRIRSAETVEKETGMVVVGTIPDEKSFTAEDRLIPFDGADTAGARAKFFGVSEAMRELRTNLQYMDVDRPPRVIVVTSPLPGDGKSTTSANLAITLAAGGQRVFLIDGDLRRPMVAKIFHLIEGVGLTDVLAGRAELADVAQRVDRTGNLLVVGAGKLPPNPSEILGSARMRELIRSLGMEATVIIDAPPLLPVTDAAVLAHSADGAIIVASVGKTTYDVLKKALQNLERAGARALGVVLNRVPRKGRGGYYDYRYTGDYYRSSAGSLPPAEAIVPAAAEPVPAAAESVPVAVGAPAPATGSSVASRSSRATSAPATRRETDDAPTRRSRRGSAS